MRRRDFIALTGGAAAALPLAARAQQPERMRRIGLLMPLAAEGSDSKPRLAAFVDTLRGLGWSEGRNLRIDARWSAGNVDLARQYVLELAADAPDIIVASGNSIVVPMAQTIRTTPIVFVQTLDPVGSGVVASLARPGGNATGFTQFEFGITAKWLELLKEIVPHLKRAAVLRDVFDPAGIGQWAALQAVAPGLGVELIPLNAGGPTEIEHAVAAFTPTANDGLVVTASAPTAVHRDLIIRLAAQRRLPAVHAYRYYVTAGGLMSYGPDTIEPYRRAAEYVDRILKGEKPADLPVQAPTKYELAVNLKTAKALGLTVSPTLLARADEVIE